MRVNTIAYLVIIFIIGYSCARKGRPEGGPKDEDAPVMVTANPPNEAINFKANKIKLYFDEYVVFKDLNKQLVVSPPLKNPPLISPQGTPSKNFTIEILDTLRANTTYTFSFGNAVRDNNEGNILESFKYVFSTGAYLDSLSLKGSVKDAFLSESVKDISVLLYKYDSTYTDSIIFKEKPYYVTSTLDTSNYKFSNLQKGKYLLLALKESAKDYIFNSKTDKIAFLKDTVSLPEDSLVLEKLSLFKEKLAYEFKRGKEVSKGRIQFGFEGGENKLNVSLLSKVSDSFRYKMFYEKDKDTLNYWYFPHDKDSLVFAVSYKDQIDTSIVKLRKKKLDSLTLENSIKNIFHPRDTLFITSNNPIIEVDTSKISLVDKDTLNVPFTAKLSKTKKQIEVLFKKEFNQNYQLTLLPKTVKDIFNQSNDTIKYRASTRDSEDYGTLTLDISTDFTSPIILEVTTVRGNLIERKVFRGNQKITINELQPLEYKIRAIVDDNDNGKWDTGKFLEKIQPEKIVYYPTTIKLRANWNVNEVFTIK